MDGEVYLGYNSTEANFTKLINRSSDYENEIGGAEGGLEYDFGPTHDPYYIVIPITILYASFFVTGTIGNIITCIVIARNKTMHTATNYYLFSLAISDLLLLLSGLPAEIYIIWVKYPYVFGEWFCVLRGLAAETSTNASILTITAFTAERYIAICHPFLSHTMSKLSRALRLIFVIWLAALLCAIPQALQFGLVEFAPGFVMCLFKKVIVKHSFEISTFVFFVIPMTIIMVLYLLIGLKLKRSNLLKKGMKKSSAKANSSMSRADRSCKQVTSRSTRRVLKMLVAVVVAFFICWAPFHIQRLIAIYGKAPGEDYSTHSNTWIEILYLTFTYLSGIFYYFSTTVNPILYNIMSNKFRNAFKETLSRSWIVPLFMSPRRRSSYCNLRPSQRRNPDHCGTGATSTGTAFEQERIDWFGNSITESPGELRQTSNLTNALQERDEVQNLSETESHIPVMEPEAISSDNAIIDVEIEGNNINVSSVPGQENEQLSPLSQFKGLSTNAENDLSMTLQSIPINKNRNVKSRKKRWQWLLSWLPGLKDMRNSHTLTTSPTLNSPRQESIIFRGIDIKKRQDHLVPLQSFLSRKTDTHRSV